MKKQILNIGKALNKAEQKEVNGGSTRWCQSDSHCGNQEWCCQGACKRRDQVVPGTCPSMDGGDNSGPGNPCGEDLLGSFNLDFTGCL